MTGPDRRATTRVPDVDYLPGLWSAAWRQLPVVAVAGLLVCVAAVPAALVAPGLSPVTLLLAAVTVGPAWAASVAVADRIVRGDDVTVRDLARAVRRYAAAGAAILLVPALLGAATLLAVEEYWAAPRHWWLLVPAGVGAVGTSLTLLGSYAAVPLRVLGVLRGRRLWLGSLVLVARAPLVPLGIAALAVLGLLAGTSVTASLLLLVPGPAALITAAGVRTVATRQGWRLDRRTSTDAARPVRRHPSH